MQQIEQKRAHEQPAKKEKKCDGKNLVLDQVTQKCRPKNELDKLLEKEQPLQAQVERAQSQQEKLQALIDANQFEREAKDYKKNKEILEIQYLQGVVAPTQAQRDRLNALESDHGFEKDKNPDFKKAKQEIENADNTYGKGALEKNTEEAALESARENVASQQQKLDQEVSKNDKVRVAFDRAQNIRQDANQKWGGKYGGLDWKSSESMNAVAGQVIQGATALNSKHMELKGSQTVQNYQNGTQTAEQTQSELLTVFGKSITSQALIEGVAAVGQLWQSGRHMVSKKRVTNAEINAKLDIDAEIAAAKTNCAANNEPECQRAEALEAEKTRVAQNRDGEHKQQNEFAGRQAILAATTSFGAAQKIVQANQAKTMAGQLGNPNYYGLNLGNTVINPGTIDPALAPAPTSDALVTPPVLEETGGDPMGTLVDTRDGDNLKGNNPPVMNLAGAPLSPGNSGGGGAGSAGGTSRAQDESGGGAAPVKDPKAGTYAAVDGGGGAGKYSSRGGGSSGDGDVKVDSAFADLLKKFLPGAEEPKTSSPLDLAAKSERSPASDQAAVIGRNKNIFDEIHKRYQKKNAEGAILF